MTQEDKQLLLCDLCARLPYKVKVYHPDYDEPQTLDTIFTPEAYSGGAIRCDVDDYWEKPHTLEDCKPYLRPMESMNIEELNAFVNLEGVALFDWIFEHHLDFRGLIKRGLAIEVTEENNPYKQQDG